MLMEKRKLHNNMVNDLEADQDVIATLSGDELEVDSGKEEYDSDSSVEDDDAFILPEPKQKCRGLNRTLHWKTKYLVFCFYAKCNISMWRNAAIIGIKQTLVLLDYIRTSGCPVA